MLSEETRILKWASSELQGIQEANLWPWRASIWHEWTLESRLPELNADADTQAEFSRLWESWFADLTVMHICIANGVHMEWFISSIISDVLMRGVHSAEACAFNLWLAAKDQFEDTIYRATSNPSAHGDFFQWFKNNHCAPWKLRKCNWSWALAVWSEEWFWTCSWFMCSSSLSAPRSITHRALSVPLVSVAVVWKKRHSWVEGDLVLQLVSFAFKRDRDWTSVLLVYQGVILWPINTEEQLLGYCEGRIIHY